MMETFQLKGVDASEFSIQNDNCSDRILSPTENCEVDVLFTPALAGKRNANLLLPLKGSYTTTSETLLSGKGLLSAPTPDINVNSADGSVTPISNLSVTVALNPGDLSGENADWWVVADTPFGWYYLNVSTISWAYAGDSYAGLSSMYQGPLFDLSSFEVLNMTGLPDGMYTFYFAVDTNMNGSFDFDQLYYDSVDVNINQ